MEARPPGGRPRAFVGVPRARRALRGCEKPVGGYGQAVEELGEPVAYTVLRDGVPVYDSDGARAGEVEHVLADDGPDIFHGLVVKTQDGHRFAARDQIADLRRDGVLLTVPAGALPEPSADPVAADADRPVGGQVQDGLRRAWEWLSQPR